MEKQEITVDSPLSLNGMSFIPVVETVSYVFESGKNGSYFIRKTPLALVVISRSDRKALDMNGDEISLEELTEKTPGLKDLLKVCVDRKPQ